MTCHERRGRRPRALVAAVVTAVVAFGVLALGLALAPAASAHATVVSSSPADGSRLQHAPAQVVIIFDEPVGLAGVGFLHVTDQSGTAVDTGATFHPGGADAKIAVRLRPGLGNGAYVASFRVISADSHPGAGSIAFVVGHGALVHGSEAGGSTTDALTGASDAVARWVGYAGLALVGGSWLLFTIWPRGRDVGRARRLVWTGWVLLAAATVLELVLQGPYSAGRGLSGLADLSLLDDTLHTDFGTTLCLRLLLLSALALVFERALRDGATPRRSDALAGVFGAGAVATFAGVGHASTTPPNWLSMTVDGLHLAAMAIWLGGLVIVLAAVLPQPATDGYHEQLARFSTVAFASVVVLAVTGTYAAWRGIGTVHAVLTTTYGQLVVAKILLFVGILVVANLSRKHVQRRVRKPATADDVGPELLRRSVLVEVAVAAVVLAVTAVLVNEPRGKEALAAQYREPVTATAQLGGSAGVAVTVTPALHGPVDVAVVVTGDQHPRVTATATQHAAQIGPLPIKLTRAHAHGAETEFDASLTLPVAGDWDIDLVVSRSRFDATTTDVTLTVH
jgi:copper transport protein